MSNTAVGSERVSHVVGYKLSGGNFAESTPNLPQSIAIVAEANGANQVTMPTDPTQVLSAQQAGDLFGFGSPIHQAVRILKPRYGDGVGGIPIMVYAVPEAGGAAARVQTLTITGNATAAATHYVKVAGRTGVDGFTYAVNIAVGDTPTQVATKVKDAISAVLGSPVTATSAAGVVTITTKWKGLTAQSVEVVMDTNGVNAGTTYVVAQTTAGAGTPSIGTTLDKIENRWDTILVNGFGTESTIMAALEAFNGRPSATNPTGRFVGNVMKPFIALTGATVEDPSTITDGRKLDQTIAICPAPLSSGLAIEAAANMCVLFARVSQDTPHLDVQNMLYPDMPTPATIGKMSRYGERDAMVKKGCSTVALSAGQYQVIDFVTTYHPDGEVVPQFRYCRNLMLDFNVRYGYYLLEQMHVVGHAIAKDQDVVSAAKVIKPKQWKAVLLSYANDLGLRGLIADVAFMKSNITVGLSTTNPDRLDTELRYKRSGFLRIASTEAVAGFNYGSAN